MNLIRQAVSTSQMRKAQTGRARFGELFAFVADGGAIDFTMFGQAIAELRVHAPTFANAPVDQFARGDLSAMTLLPEEGAVEFSGRLDVLYATGGRSVKRDVQRLQKPRGGGAEIAP